MAGISLKNVSKVYRGGVHAVTGVSLDIADGEFVILVGPSGCGKSTVLRMIAGLEDVTGGLVSIGGAVMNDVPPKDRNVSMVFQSYALYPHMTVFQNMAYGLKLRGTPKKETERRVLEVAAVLGIERLLERKPRALSGGERQRVALGRAMVPFRYSYGGWFLTAEHGNMAVIPSSLAVSLLGTREPEAAVITVNGTEYAVCGVYEEERGILADCCSDGLPRLYLCAPNIMEDTPAASIYISDGTPSHKLLLISQASSMIKRPLVGVSTDYRVQSALADSVFKLGLGLCAVRRASPQRCFLPRRALL